MGKVLSGQPVWGVPVQAEHAVLYELGGAEVGVLLTVSVVLAAREDCHDSFLHLL